MNHQLRFHPKVLELLELVRGGAIGDVRLVDGSARLGLGGQGTHILNLVFAFAGDTRPVEILGQATGQSLWMTSTHPAPDTALATVNCAMPPKYFTDYLTLLRTDAGWQIISKTYHVDIHE